MTSKARAVPLASCLTLANSSKALSTLPGSDPGTLAALSLCMHDFSRWWSPSCSLYLICARARSSLRSSWDEGDVGEDDSRWLGDCRGQRRDQVSMALGSGSERPALRDGISHTAT